MTLPGMRLEASGVMIGHIDLSELVGGNRDRTAIIETKHCPLAGDYHHTDHQKGMQLARRGYTVFYTSDLDPAHRPYARHIFEKDK